MENEMLDHVFNSSQTPPATVYLALGTGASDSGLTGEPSGNGYAREAISFDAAASREVSQTSQIAFGPVTTTNWGTMTHWAIFDALTSGNCMAWGTFTTGKACNIGNTPKVNAAEVKVQFNSGGISTTWVHNLLNRFFRNITTGTDTPDTYVALCTSAPVDSDTDITAKEPSGNGYARKLVDGNGGSSPTWDLAASGVVDNTHLVQMATPTGSWGTISHMAICDALTTGNLICYDDITDEQCDNGDDVEFPAGDLDITLT